MRTRIADSPLDHISIDSAGCWLWTKGTFKSGYGAVRVKDKVLKAHRYIFELHKGPIPTGLVLDHLCRVPLCVNPDHLEPVTQGENIRRAPNAATTINSTKTACPVGHPYSDENTYHWRGRRICRECGRKTSREWQRAKAKSL